MEGASNSLSGFPPEFQPQIQSHVQEILNQAISDVNDSLVPILSTFAAFGYFIGDWTSSLADEALVLKQITGRKAKPAHFFYFLARLFGFLFLLLNLLFTVNGRTAQSEFNCSAVPKVFWAFNMIALGSAYALLALRCSALLGKRTALTSLVYFAAAGTTLSYITGFVGLSGEQTFTGFISCTLYPVKKYVAISYLISFLYDSLITFLSIAGLISSTQNRQATMKGPSAAFLREIIKGNAIYFLVLVSFSLGTGILTLVNVHPQTRAVLSAPHTATSVCMSLKIFRHLRSSIVNPILSSNKGEAGNLSGSSGSGGKQGEPRRARQASFSSSFSPPTKRSEKLHMMEMQNNSGDLERLTDHY